MLSAVWWLLAAGLLLSLSLSLSPAQSLDLNPDLDLEEVTRTRRSWEQSCLTPSAGAGSGAGSGAGAAEDRDPRWAVQPHCSVFYLHNHKTGGSTMCRTAQLNGLKISGLGDNCNIPPAVRRNKNINHQQYVFEKKLQFVAQEDKPFHLNASNSRFIYMTTMRNPMDRLVSHLHHEFCGRDGSQMSARLHAHTCNSAPRTLSDLIADPCFGSQHMRSITTDYYLAMLTGCANRLFDGKKYLPPEKNTCNEDHLTEAKKILNYFSVILISDNSADFNKYGELLDLRLSITFKEQYRTGTHANSDNVVHELLTHNATSRFVMEMVTSLDMKLYEYAKHLAESQLETEKAGLQALAQFRKKHPARMRRRLQPTHSAPAHEFTRGQQMMKEMKQRISPVIESKRYVEGPFC